MGNRPIIKQYADYKMCPAPDSDWSINPQKTYPESYHEFMNLVDCTWNYYGSHGHFHDIDATIDEA